MEEELKKFHVISVISNPVRYESRYKLYRRFEEEMQDAGVNFWTVEIAFGDRPFECTEARDPFDIQLRGLDEIWHKENMINIALSRLPNDWKYVAWVDADITFQRPDWALETIQQLQHYQVVQMFGHAIDLGPEGDVLQVHNGFVRGYIDNGFKNPNPHVGEKRLYGVNHGSFAHPGYAWAATREAIEATGGLIDWAILGSGDHHMAMALIGEVSRTYPSQIHSRYKAKTLLWQERALTHIKKDIGYVQTAIIHHWHGKKVDRRYQDRWRILLDNGFDPDLDLVRDSQGLWKLTDHNLRLRDQMRAYFRARKEDARYND